MGVEVDTQPGTRRGQFDVQVDGRTVFTRKGGLVAKLLRKPWPEPAGAVSAVRMALERA